MHCDALLPSGYSTSGGGNKYSKNILSLLLSQNIPFIYFTEQKTYDLESFMQLAPNAYFYRINIIDNNLKKESLKYKENVISYITPILSKYSQYKFVFHSIYWYSGEIAEHFSNKYKSYFIHTVISNEKSKIAQNATDYNAEKRCEIEQYIFEQAKYIICSSASEAMDIEKYYHISREKLVITGRIIDKEFLNPYTDLYGNPRTNNLSIEIPVHYINETSHLQLDEILSDWTRLRAFLYVGRIHENKGIVQIISAWEHLYHKYNKLTPPLWIVGGSPQEIIAFRNDYIKDKPFLSKMESIYKLTWWGTLSPDSISALMGKSLVLVTHSKYEAGGNVILEAMAHSLPVIATPFGYGKDYIRHDENGYIVQYNDIHSLEKYMEYFIKQPYLTNYMGRIAAKNIREIICQWNFKEKHMKMYGLNSPNIIPNYVDYNIPKDSIDTYFNRLILPEEKYIYYLISTKTSHKIDKIHKKENLHNYILWEITVSDKIHYFYFLYSILNRLCLKENCEDYIITKYQRIEHIEEECLKEGIKIHFLDKYEGYAYLDNTVRNIL